MKSWLNRIADVPWYLAGPLLFLIHTVLLYFFKYEKAIELYVGLGIKLSASAYHIFSNIGIIIIITHLLLSLYRLFGHKKAVIYSVFGLAIVFITRALLFHYLDGFQGINLMVTHLLPVIYISIPLIIYTFIAIPKQKTLWSLLFILAASLMNLLSIVLMGGLLVFKKSLFVIIIFNILAQLPYWVGLWLLISLHKIAVSKEINWRFLTQIDLNRNYSKLEAVTIFLVLRNILFLICLKVLIVPFFLTLEYRDAALGSSIFFMIYEWAILFFFIWAYRKFLLELFFSFGNTPSYTFWFMHIPLIGLVIFFYTFFSSNSVSELEQRMEIFKTWQSRLIIIEKYRKIYWTIFASLFGLCLIASLDFMVIPFTSLSLFIAVFIGVLFLYQEKGIELLFILGILYLAFNFQYIVIILYRSYVNLGSLIAFNLATLFLIHPVFHPQVYHTTSDIAIEDLEVSDSSHNSTPDIP